LFLIKLNQIEIIIVQYAKVETELYEFQPHYATAIQKE